MNTIKVTTHPKPDDPDLLRSVTEWVNLAYAAKVKPALTFLGRRARVASINTNSHLAPYFLRDGRVSDVVFCLNVPDGEENIRFHFQMDAGGILELRQSEFVLLPELPPNPIPAEVPMNDKGWVPPRMGKTVLGPEEAMVGKRVRIINADRFPGKYLEDGIVRQVFTSGSGQSFVIQLMKNDELLKDVLESEVRFL